MLQPRIFVLLRRCIFDSDDEVSFCRIMHFCEIHLNWYVILLTLYMSLGVYVLKCVCVLVHKHPLIKSALFVKLCSIQPIQKFFV
jgi:hypothetical protein